MWGVQCPPSFCRQPPVDMRGGLRGENADSLFKQGETRFDRSSFGIGNPGGPRHFVIRRDVLYLIRTDALVASLSGGDVVLRRRRMPVWECSNGLHQWGFQE
jgi:hypothetical protein